MSKTKSKAKAPKGAKAKAPTLAELEKEERYWRDNLAYCLSDPDCIMGDLPDDPEEIDIHIIEQFGHDLAADAGRWREVYNDLIDAKEEAEAKARKAA